MIADTVVCGWIVLVAVWFFAPYLGVVAPEPIGRLAYVLIVIGSVLSAGALLLQRRRTGPGGVDADG